MCCGFQGKLQKKILYNFSFVIFIHFLPILPAGKFFGFNFKFILKAVSNVYYKWHLNEYQSSY